MSQARFRSSFSESIFNQKYKHAGAETWDELARTLVLEVTAGLMTPYDQEQLIQYVEDMKFIPGGRYLYYAGRTKKFYNNCYLFKAEEDTREDWAKMSWQQESALMTGGGTGADYSIYRGEGSPLGDTGGLASGPIPKIEMTNEIGRRVMQGGSRRSALWAGLSAEHPDAEKFLYSKDWDNQLVAGTGGLSVGDLKRADFNYHAPLDMTNISLLYGDEWLYHYEQTLDVGHIFKANVRQALKTAEPGFAFNFGKQANETLRNACTEVTSEDNADVCNLGSLNLGRIENIRELADVIRLSTMFLICGTLRAQLPFKKIAEVREKNRRLGLGLMGVHEWLIKKGYRYEVTEELHQWLTVYRDESDRVSAAFADVLGISRPVANRAIAPTGTIGIMASTSTGIEPLFATAYQRRYLKGGTNWHYQYVVDATTKELVKEYGVDPDSIETALDLAMDYERRIAFQADVQDYVDMAISSTINLPAWGSEYNNEDTVDDFAATLARYAKRLRGFTCYADGARGGQPLTVIPYSEAIRHEGQEFSEQAHDICEIGGKGGTCGV